MRLYLVKRGPCPSHHLAPFHPVVLCDRKDLAKRTIGNTSDGATVWEQDDNLFSSGWLMVRYQGLDIDYWPVMSGPVLFDGTKTGFVHDRGVEPWTLLRGAVWWSPRIMPGPVANWGVIYPPDGFTQQRILDSVADLEAEKRFRAICSRTGGMAIGFSCSGFGRPRPAHWPEPVEGCS